MRIETYYNMTIEHESDKRLLSIIADISNGDKKLCLGCKTIYNSGSLCPMCQDTKNVAPKRKRRTNEPTSRKRMKKKMQDLGMTEEVALYFPEDVRDANRRQWVVYQCTPSSEVRGRRADHNRGCGVWRSVGTRMVGQSFQTSPCHSCDKRRRVHPGNYIVVNTEEEALGLLDSYNTN